MYDQAFLKSLIGYGTAVALLLLLVGALFSATPGRRPGPLATTLGSAVGGKSGCLWLGQLWSFLRC